MSILFAFKKPFFVGSFVGFLHLFLCLIVFAFVQLSSDGQAGFIWFAFHTFDYPIGSLAYELLGDSRMIITIVDWWYSSGRGNGSNLRAFLLFGVFGSLQWFLIASAAAVALKILFSIWGRRQRNTS